MTFVSWRLWLAGVAEQHSAPSNVLFNLYHVQSSGSCLGRRAHMMVHCFRSCNAWIAGLEPGPVIRLQRRGSVCCQSVKNGSSSAVCHLDPLPARCLVRGAGAVRE